MRTWRPKMFLLCMALLAYGGAWPRLASAQDDDLPSEDEDDGGAKTKVTGKAATDAKPAPPKDDPAQAEDGEKMRVESSTHVRRFHEVLDELLAEFGYDVKMGQIKGLSNISVRKVRVSDAIPKTYEEYVEVLLQERIRENSQVRIIECVPCKTRTSSLVDGKLMITSPATNMAKLEAAASQLGIEYFMDAVLVYHTTHMVLAISVFNAQTKELVWARTYNSETIKSRYQKLAVDYSQVEKSRPGEDYVPEYRFMWGLGGAGLPNIGGTKDDSSMLDLQVRATEKFNNRHTEFGLLVSLLKTTNSLVKSYPSTPASGSSSTGTSASGNPPATQTQTVGPQPQPFQQAYGIYGLFSHLFIGSVESYNEIRQGIHIGIGGILATGYLAPAARIGWDVYMGRRFSVSIAGDYIAPSTIVVDGQSLTAKGGTGADAIISLNY